MSYICPRTLCCQADVLSLFGRLLFKSLPRAKDTRSLTWRSTTNQYYIPGFFTKDLKLDDHQVEFDFVDGYAGEKSLLEAEATAMIGS